MDNGPRPEDEVEVARLAGLSLVAYEHEREAAAKRLGVRVSILDDIVESNVRGAPSGRRKRRR